MTLYQGTYARVTADGTVYWIVNANGERITRHPIRDLERANREAERKEMQLRGLRSSREGS